MAHAFKSQKVDNIPGTKIKADSIGNEEAEQLLGCTFAHYKEYIENQFKQYPGTSWSNMAAIEIDHKLPVSNFDISSLAGAQQAFSFRNTQALPKVLHAVKTAIEDLGNLLPYQGRPLSLSLSLCHWLISCNFKWSLLLLRRLSLSSSTSETSNCRLRLMLPQDLCARSSFVSNCMHQPF